METTLHLYTYYLSEDSTSDSAVIATTKLFKKSIKGTGTPSNNPIGELDKFIITKENFDGFVDLTITDRRTNTELFSSKKELKERYDTSYTRESLSTYSVLEVNFIARKFGISSVRTRKPNLINSIMEIVDRERFKIGDVVAKERKLAREDNNLALQQEDEQR